MFTTNYAPEAYAIDILNTPISFTADDLALPDSLAKILPQGASLIALPADASPEQQKAVLAKKADCASYVAGYSCGNHNAADVPSGDLISVNAGDEVSGAAFRMNSIKFEVVDLDASGNGSGIVSVPMRSGVPVNNAKLGVDCPTYRFKNIKVAKGGRAAFRCVVEGEADLSHVDVALLSDQQRAKIDAAFKVYNQALAFIGANADEAAGSINQAAAALNTFLGKLNAIKDNAATLMANIGAGTLTQKNVNYLNSVTAQTTAQMEAVVKNYRATQQQNINNAALQTIDSLIAINKASVAVLTNFKVGRDTPETLKTATQNLATLVPATISAAADKLTQKPLAVEYNGKLYAQAKKPVTIQINNKSKTLNLKNLIPDMAFSWNTDSGLSGNINPIDLSFPEGISKMKLDVTQGDRKTSVVVIKEPELIIEGLTLIDAKHNARKVTAGQTLYMVGEGNVKATVNATGLKSPFTNSNLAWELVAGSNSIPQDLYAGKSSFTRDFGSNGVGIDERKFEIRARNILGDDKSVKLVVVDEDREKLLFETGSETYGDIIKKAYQYSKATDEIAKKLDKIPFLKRVKNAASKDESAITWFWNVIPFEQTQTNKEGDKSNLYYRERIVGGGFELGIKGNVEWPIWEIPFNRLPLPTVWISNIEKYIKAEVVATASASASGEIKAELKSKKWVNTNTWINEKANINPAVVSLKAEIGAKAELKILKNFDYFSISAEASAYLNAEILKAGYFNNSFNLEYFNEGLKLNVKTEGSINLLGFNYNLTPFYKQFSIYK